jgi:alkylation response protein AidB-like acyl-CoA dehydrogenase
VDYELTETHKLIRDTARRIARERVQPRAAEIDEQGQYPEDIFGVFREAGLMGLTIPVEYGGAASFLALALAVEETAKYCCSCGLILLLSALSTQSVVIGGSEEQKRAWLTRSAAGEIRGAYCLTEPNAGSDAAAIESRARRDGDGYVIDGEKMFISGGSVADFVVTFAKTDPAAGSRCFSAFIVPTDNPGFSVTRLDSKMGVTGVPTAGLLFQDCRVPAASLIGEEGRGFRIAMLTMSCVRPIVGARGLGLAQGALAYALEFARERRTFGRPILEHQAIQFMLADMATQIEAARHLIYHACTLIDRGKYERQYAPYLSFAKVFATEMAVKVSSDALQILGAQGYMKDHPLERHYRDARQLMIVEGTSQIQRMIIARGLAEGDIVYG